ncbi:hypothetical protein NK718_20985 [Alsobacter sp. SYSU M60028]|uniref:Outer membrane protein beta-barrel domain-containing protein n=1 Tax=Alsobacter ponti TaxID=2962936 RepID=A0ABT1LHM3_9HYPH|nr:hypothetical protein [Alsobacter ponti]MCP8941007.1 hypothetical protein [Alsobacter ponti]
MTEWTRSGGAAARRSLERVLARGLATGAAALVCAISQAAVAADLGAPVAPAAPAPVVEPAPSWTFAVSVYGWASGIEGRVRTLPPLPAADINVGFDKLLQNLQGAVMASGEARYGRFVLFTDLIFSKIAPTLAPPDGYDRLKLESSSVIGLAAGGYRLYEGNGFTMDGLVGVRGFGMKNTLEAHDPINGYVSLSKSEVWADAVAGVRMRYEFTRSFSAIAVGFAGGGGSKYEWDLFGGLSYAFNETWGAFLGYRALKVDYKNGDFEYDVLQHGPILGVNIRF